MSVTGIKLHQLRDMRLLRSMTSASVSLSVAWEGHAKTAERIAVLFGVEIPENPRNIVLDRGPHPLQDEREGVRCGLCQITLASCY